MRKILIAVFTFIIIASTNAGCGLLPTAAPQMATIVANLDLGTGGSGFAATIYAQDVTSGKTFEGTYSAGAHGAVILPTSAPVSIQVEAPGTYVVYAVNVEAPDDYHWGATGCKAATDCASKDLVAIDVKPGESYPVTITERSALLPTPESPVTVPWRR